MRITVRIEGLFLVLAVAVAIPAGCAGGRLDRESLGSVTPDASVGALSGLRFAPQPGWASRAPASSMRAAEFDLEPATGAGGRADAGAGANGASLIVYYFGAGAAGSVDANIERWCGQFEQPDGSRSSDVARIDDRSVNGLDVRTIDLGGTYVAETRPGSGERVNEPDWHLLAAIVQTEAGPYYFKLVGPAPTVARWRGSYEMMLDSLEPAPVAATAGADVDHP